MLMTHGSMERNNVYLCAKYVLPVQHLDVKLFRVAINKVRKTEDVSVCNTGQVIRELCLVRDGLYVIKNYSVSENYTYYLYIRPFIFY